MKALTSDLQQAIMQVGSAVYAQAELADRDRIKPPRLTQPDF